MRTLSRPAAIQYHACFAPALAGLLPDLDFVRVLLQIDDGSGTELLPGAVDYEEALASVPAEVIVPVRLRSRARRPRSSSPRT